MSTLSLLGLLNEPSEALESGEWVCICTRYKDSTEWEWRGDPHGPHYRQYRLMQITRSDGVKWRATAHLRQGLSVAGSWHPDPREAMLELREVLADLFRGCPTGEHPMPEA